MLRAAEQTAQYFAARPTIVRELEELREVLEDRVGLARQVLPVPGWSLALHCHYSRREIVAGIGYVTAGEKAISLQGGILKLEDRKRELLFVTLDKSGKRFSPTTRYRDYARARRMAGRFSCSCAPIPTRTLRSSARSPTTRTPEIA